MKPKFSKSSGRLRGKAWAFLLGLVLSVFAAKATDSLDIFSGTISGTPPNVDATNFYNSGTWNISTATPYETQNTLNYTNAGSMTGSVGWEFDFGPLPLGGRGLSANFVNNRATATVQANDGLILNPGGIGSTLAEYLVSYLLISATNIVNNGTLIAGAHGEIVLNGANVTLSRSILETTPIQGQGSPNGTTNYTPDVQVYSLFWGTNNMGLNSSTLWNGTNVFMSGPFSFLVDGNYFDFPSSSSLYGTVYNENGGCGATKITAQIVPFTPAAGSDSTNIVVAVTNIVFTNYSSGPVGNPGLANLPVQIIRQAVFLNVNTNYGITGQVRFSPSPSPTNYAQTVAVRLSATSTNVTTLLPQTTSIYLVDTLVSQTNYGLNVSTEIVDPYYACSGPVYRPANYNVERTDLGNYFANGSPGSGLPANNFFYSLIGSPGVGFPQAGVFFNPNLISSVAPANYADYAAYIDNLSSDQQLFSAVTNLGGRIIINANNLDLTRADLVAGGYIKIQASNLVSSANAVVSCQYLSYNLGSTNGNLNFTNLASQSIPQLQGNVVAWSAEWTNFATQVISNYVFDTTASNYDIPAFFTNTTEIDFYALVVDASSLSDQVPVTVQDLILHSTNIVVSDDMTVANSFLLDGINFTLLGEIDLSGVVQNWTGANAPNLLYFTNNGYLSIPNNADFGGDTAVPYVEFINSGYINAGDQTIDSLDLQIVNGINDTSVGDFSAIAGSIEITGPTFASYSIYSNSIYSANDIQLSANTLLINSAALYANGALDFTVTTNLSDNGTACSFTCYNGFNLWIKPQTGDLFGSIVTSIASVDKEEIAHAWAGNDYGPVGAGFTNNVAIGTLVLSAQNPHTNIFLLEPLFHFYGAGVSGNAMYVNTLDLSQLTTNATDVANMILIDPGMKIYFESVTLGFTLPGYQTPEDFLQQLFPNQFVKVPDFVVAQGGTVNWNTVYQRIDGFGASSAWQSTWTTNQADLFFSTNSGLVYTNNNKTFVSTNNGIGLSLLRTRIAPGGTTVETNIMQMAQARGARVWSTPWSPAAQFKSNAKVNGGGFVGNAANYQAYANQLAGYVANMTNNYGVSLYAISVQNEPDSYNVTNYESCNWSAQQIHDFVPYLYNALAASNAASTMIMLPEAQNWPDYSNLVAKAMSDSTSNKVGIIADHNYDGANGPATLTKNSYGKALWQTEVALLSGSDSGIINGVYYAQRIHLFMTVAQANAWHYWWLMSGNSTGNEGLMDNTGFPAKRMYALGNFSRFVRPGYYRVGVTYAGSALLVSAYMDTTTSNFAIVAVNTNNSIDVNQTFSLANFPGAGTVTPWITSSNLSLASQPAVTVNNLSFTYPIPARSVVTFVGQATNAPGVQLLPVPNQTINAGVTLLVTNAATDPNVPPPGLTFTLLNGPANATLATLNTTNAMFAWRPLVSQANTTNVITVKVAENGPPNQSANKNFTVTVNPFSQPILSSVVSSGGQIKLGLTGTTGPDYTLWTSTNLVTWQTLFTTNSPPLPLTLTVTNTGSPARFYRIQAGP